MSWKNRVVDEELKVCGLVKCLLQVKFAMAEWEDQPSPELSYDSDETRLGTPSSQHTYDSDETRLGTPSPQRLGNDIHTSPQKQSYSSPELLGTPSLQHLDKNIQQSYFFPELLDTPVPDLDATIRYTYPILVLSLHLPLFLTSVFQLVMPLPHIFYLVPLPPSMIQPHPTLIPLVMLLVSSSVVMMKVMICHLTDLFYFSFFL